MSLYRRGNIWYVQYTTPDGNRVQQSAGTSDKQKAQELHDRLKADSWRVSRLGDRPVYLWQQAATQWLKEQAHKKSIEDDRGHLRWLHRFLHNKPLHTIDRSLAERIRKAKIDEGASQTRANRVLATMRGILRKAEREWGWIDKAPPIRMAPEPKQRVRWLPQAEALRLFASLPSHLAQMAEFAVLTGLRESNVTGLRWEWIDLEKRQLWIPPEETKNGIALGIPLNSDALRLILAIPGTRTGPVFTYKGRQVTRANNTAWRKALKREGITNFRFHDLRHTWASWHVQAGTPLHVLQQLGGWEDLKMVLKYAHLSSTHLADHAEGVSLLRQGQKKGPTEGA
jgi:integrase